MATSQFFECPDQECDWELAYLPSLISHWIVDHDGTVTYRQDWDGDIHVSFHS